MDEPADLGPFCVGLAQRFGLERTWSGSLQALGYPASWITELSEALVVHRQLESEGDTAMRMNAREVGSPDDVGSSSLPPKPGVYQVVVNDVDESLEKHDKIIVDFAVVKGTVPGQEGRTFRQFLAIDGKGFDHTLKFALIAGLIQPGEDKDVNFGESKGSQMVVKLNENSYTNKNGKKVDAVQVDWCAFWPIGHQDVRDVPIDPEAWRCARNNPTRRPAEAVGAQAQRSPDPQPQAAGSAWDTV